jgi:hypothetical protein
LGLRKPKIQWQKLPREVRTHLTVRIRRRKVSAEDLVRLDEWIQTNPEGPEGDWYKDFGSFKICGRGALPLTVLEDWMAPYGEKLD